MTRTMLLEFLIGLLVLLGLVALVAAAACAYFLLPLSDMLNLLARRIGLAGPSPESRSVGVESVGTVAGRFSVRAGEGHGVGKVFVKGELWNALCPAPLAPALSEGDAVRIVYNTDLTVTVLGKAEPTG